MTTTQPITVRRTEFAELLTDLAPHVHTDDDLPMLNAVSLHTAQHNDTTVLVGSATDRFTLAQAHIPLTPTADPGTPAEENEADQPDEPNTPRGAGLPQVFLPQPAVHRVRQWVRTHRTSRQDDYLHIAAATGSGHGTVTFTFDHDGGSLTEYTDSGAQYPDLGRMLEVTAKKPFVPAAINPTFLGRFIATAHRRGEPMHITTHGHGQPTEIAIGDHYRGLAMSTRLPTTDSGDLPEPAPVFLLPSEPGESATQAAAPNPAREAA